MFQRQRVQWNKTYSTIALAKSANGTYSIALLGNGIFYSISRDHKQPIERSEFNKVLYWGGGRQHFPCDSNF
jgi:hypothetical protein